MFIEDLCRIKQIDYITTRKEMMLLSEQLHYIYQLTNARRNRRANFLFFSNFFLKTGCVLILQFQISEEVFTKRKIFFKLGLAFAASQWE